MLTSKELWEKAGTGELITLEDVGLPFWRRDCDGFYYELNNLLCRGGIAYRHKDGYIWSNGDFLTLRECKIYELVPGVMNQKKRCNINGK